MTKNSLNLVVLCLNLLVLKIIIFIAFVEKMNFELKNIYDSEEE